MRQGVVNHPASEVSHHTQTTYGNLEPDGDQGTQTKGDDSHSLDTGQHAKDYRQIYDWWVQARTVQAPGRYEQSIDEDFYDGLQWTEEDQLVVESRGQPALVFNQVKPVVDWIIGTQKRSKFDWHIYPRTEDDREPAEVKTKVLKYTEDANHAPFYRSRAFADAAKVGIGWLEDGIRGDPTDEPLYSRAESWRNMWYDHLATEPDLSDARYLYRARWVDVDIATAYFPNRQGVIRAAAQTHDLYGGTDDDEAYISQLYYRTDYQGRPLPRRSYIEDASYAVNNRRSRVRLVECWYRKPVPRKILRVHDVHDQAYARLNGEVYDEQNAEAKGLVDDGIASAYDAIKLEIWCAIFVEGSLLQNKPSPYKHDAFPFTPVWGYRRKRDGASYGAIRNMRDPQEDLNKRISKAQHILNTNQVIAEEGAVVDVEEAREEVAAPDGWITVRNNKKFEINRDNAVAAQHIELAMLDKQFVRETGGVTTENLGHQTNATSGKAIEARQSEGAVVTTELFDNLHYAGQLQGEKRLSLVEQYYSAPKVIRLTNERGGNEFTTVNDVVGVGPNGEPIVENDITATKADFIVDQVDFRTSIRQAMFEQLFEMLGELMKMGDRGGEAAWNLLDVVIDMAPDLPQKDVLVARIRKLNKQPDPALEGSPEAEEDRQAREDEDREVAALQKRAVVAELEAKEADTTLKKQKAFAEVVGSLKEMAETGGQLLVTPEVAAMVDEIQAMVNEQIQNAPPEQVAA